MPHPVTLIPGDSTGPEICEVVQTVIAKLGVDIDWQTVPAVNGMVGADLVESVRRTKTALKAYQHGRRDESIAPPVVQLRRELNAWANLRPVHHLPNITKRFDKLNLLVVRETSEDIYANMEHESIPGVFESVKVTTEVACERIARFAFEHARKVGRKKVTIVHKSNIMKKSDGMFLRVGQRVAADFPDIECNECIVDALCMKLIIDPTQFDVLLCGNLFGDIVADVVAGIGGGASNAPSISIADGGVRVFAASHGDPKSAVGTGNANPLTLLIPAVPMLRHLGETDAANRLMKAITSTLAEGNLPVSLGGEANCADIQAAIIARI